MQAEFANQLRRAVSNERLEGYITKGADRGEDNLFSHYAWNIALAESLYPALQCLEVALRNTLHTAIIAKSGRIDWYDGSVLKGEEEKRKLDKAKRTLTERRKALDPGKVVAELTFGFWSCLLDRRYERELWPHILRTAFPRVPNFLRTRNHISAEINDLRDLRNRAFHHEPIWHWRDLEAKHAKIITVIGWINPAMQTYVNAIDRFPQIYTAGVAGYQALVKRMGEPPAPAAQIADYNN